ncbi:MAG: hypothetical protein LBN06_11100 [Prevotellaceae bacterium]|jgi:RNAse (barnase) inhibitor barstar|nr:hypothetical protein [Prevotellaceae bacterium]
MATKYSDFITIRESKPAYNIGREEKGEWETFIPNEQFNGILQKVISAVRNNDKDVHKSFWMDGTYGTGKSHAAAVIKHLLCDEVDDIREYVDTEYAAQRYDMLRQSIYDIRKTKRLFPVNLYGTESIAHKEDFSHRLQSAIKKALKAAGLTNFFVKTDFDDYADHVESEPTFWEDIIVQNPKLEAYASDVKTLAGKLRAADTSILTQVKMALADRRMDIRLNSANICDWFFEVQDKLEENTDYCGLLIIWDEFTDLMKSDMGPSLLVELQKITEQAMETCNNSYFFFVSHPSALNKLDAQERTKTTGRYHYKKYNMETVSAFKIMSRKLRITNPEGYKELTTRFFEFHKGLLLRYAKGSNNMEDTMTDLTNLYPIHPATANLATYYARVVGSSSRSVFEFIGANQAVRDFLESKERFDVRDTITADYLWDYVIEVFNEDHIRYGAVTERFNSYKLQVQNQGADTFVVFKGILLLNALNNVASNETVTPSEENVKSLFVGTHIEPRINDILNWLNDNSIIQRAPGGIFSIQFSALPPKEIEEIKQEMKAQFKYTFQLATYGQEVYNAFDMLTANVIRPTKINFYSLYTNEPALLHQIENSMENAKSYELYLAVMLGRNDAETNELKVIAARATGDERFANVAFMVFEATFGDDNYERFIEYMANAQCAARHNLADQRAAHDKNAQTMISDWMKEVRRSNFTVYEKGRCEIFSTMKLTQALNESIAPMVFSHGAETLDLLRTRAPRTFWRNQQAKETAKNILMFNTYDEVISKAIGPALPLKFLFQDAVDENLNWKDDVDKENHPLYLVSDFVNRKIKYADKAREFNFAEKFIELTRAPYGLFPSYAGISMLAFAMRPWINKIYATDGKPRLAQHLVDDVMETFKSWESGKTSNKITFTFETKEAGQLSKRLIKVFKLTSMKTYSDISSLKDARWAISHEYTTEKGYPLWTLKYADGVNEELALLIDKIVTISLDANINKNPALMNDALDLLSRYEFELPMLLNRNTAFEEGYHKYLKSNDIVALDDEHLSDAKTYIKQHLPGEIGLWTEREVNDKLKDWKLSQTQTPTPIPPTPPTPDPPIPVAPPNTSQSPSPTKVEEAMQCIKSISSLAEAQCLLEQLCSLGYEDVLNVILEN